jgi:hypothetical protein
MVPEYALDRYQTKSELCHTGAPAAAFIAQQQDAAPLLCLQTEAGGRNGKR